MTTPIFFSLLVLPVLLLCGRCHGYAYNDDVHDLLPSYGFPRGLLPDNVVSYTLPSSSSDGSFSVQLSSPCYVQFHGQLVYYDVDISGRLSYGVVTDVVGIQAKELFIWLSVTGMKVNKENGAIEFYVGALSKSLPEDEFADIPTCRKRIVAAEVASS
ncbi:hypothetical protein MLD38_040311 [Melastoma candidum]|uniref:Uncharacterized protein n=1 Tax=Melastoma candidum TaxID=119954 RepID=A0ACB9L5K1_9MYRT|nr:hypothetical protein MLD38_040311 [Melastoma candidum]